MDLFLRRSAATLAPLSALGKRGEAVEVKKATSGMRPNIGDASSAAKNPEFVDPSKLFSRVNNLYDSGRLQEAVGEQGANNLLEHNNAECIPQGVSKQAAVSSQRFDCQQRPPAPDWWTGQDSNLQLTASPRTRRIVFLTPPAPSKGRLPRE
jgi:hypothetical protein